MDGKKTGKRFPADATDQGSGKRPGSAEIANALRSEFAAGTLRVGAALPSVDALRRRFGAGEYAVRHALQRLRDDGFIVLRPHVGARATDKAHQAWKGTVLFVALAQDGSFYPHGLATHLSRRIEAAGWRFAHVFPEIAHDGSIDDSQIRRHLANGVDFAIGLFARPALSAMLARAGVPHVIVNGFTRDFPAARAVFKVDISGAFGELLDAFRAARVKNVLEFDFERVMDRSFKVQLVAGGFNVRQIMAPVAEWRDAGLKRFKAAGYSAVTGFLKTRGTRRLPDVILFDDDYFATGGVSALLEAGLRIPGDIRVASFMNKGNELEFGRKIAGVGCDPAADGRAIADYAISFLNGANPRPPRLRWRYFPGESL